ncbi:MAG TPA: HAD family phosphatase [Tepidisphaeraceae bacterium]|nr:HAD family phosphatase [Tepidisphaeraceae bacterium]
MQLNGMGVIFDVDGVLVNSYRAHLESWQRAAAKHQLKMTEDDFARTFGRTSRDIIAHLWPGRFDEAGIGKFDEEKESAYRDILRVKFPEMAGASDLIASLHEAGFKLAIGSSGPPENVQLVKQTIRHGEFISAMVNGKDVKHGKPNPEVFLIAAKKLALEAGKCAVVEDAPVGLEAARRAGMAAIGLTGTAKRDALAVHAHVVVDHLSDLTPKIVAELIATRL